MAVELYRRVVLGELLERVGVGEAPGVEAFPQACSAARALSRPAR